MARKSYAVIGLGQFGTAVCEQLIANGADVIAMDVDEERVKHISSKISTAFIADATQEGVLKHLGVQDVDTAIVAFGENSAVPHHKSGNKKLSYEMPVLIDMGCKYNGYCSDMTRTIFVGEVPEYVKPVYELVLKNQEQVLRDLKEQIEQNPAVALSSRPSFTAYAIMNISSLIAM